MKASVVDLRYKMNDVLKALDRGESVTVVSRGKVKGKLVPVSDKKQGRVVDHPFFSMKSDSQESVLDELDRLRNSRTHDI